MGSIKESCLRMFFSVSLSCFSKESMRVYPLSEASNDPRRSCSSPGGTSSRCQSHLPGKNGPKASNGGCYKIHGIESRHMPGILGSKSCTIKGAYALGIEVDQKKSQGKKADMKRVPDSWVFALFGARSVKFRTRGKLHC